MQHILITGGGKITCLRCTALSKRTGVQCARPASKGSKTQKCHMHGGRGNSAPKTEEGRQRVAAAHTKSGQYTNAAKFEQSRSSARLAQLEDAMHVLGMTSAKRTRGRKSNLYVPVTSVANVHLMMVDEILHRDRGSNGA
jgi:glycerol-3-phosphate dehydrogenase